MARKIGDVTIEGDYDGDRALRQAKKNVDDLAKMLEDRSKDSGKASGDAWSENFSNTMRDRMSSVQNPFYDNMRKRADKAGSGAGHLYTRGFDTAMRANIKKSVDDSINDLARLGEPGGLDKLAKKLGSVDLAMKRYEDALRDASDAGAISEYHTLRLADAVDKQEKALRKELETQREASQALIDRAKLEKQLVRQIHEAIGARRTHAAAQLQDQLQTLIGADAMRKYSSAIREATEESQKMIGPIYDREKAQRVAVEQMRIAIRTGDKNTIAMRRSKLESIAGADALKRLGIVIPDVTKKTNGLMGAWKGMSHNARQWTLIIGAIAAALPILSVLGSAAGGALAVLGNSAVTLVAGIGLAVVGFKGLFDESMKLTEGATASRDAFRELGQAFKDLQPGIVNSMFDSMAGSIENLTAKLIPGITDKLYELSGAVGGAMGSLMDIFASPEAINIFNGLMDDAAKTIGPLLEGLGSLFLGILSIFDQAGPLAESFAGWISEIGKNFLSWTQGEAGRERIAKWLETAERILPLVGELLVATGQALADLVTPSSIANTESFLDAISAFMGPLSGLLDILGELDVFGVLASLLNSVGQALAPLQAPMAALAGLIGTTLKSALDTLGPAFGALADFLAPIITAVTDFLAPIFERIANDVLPVVVSAFSDLMKALEPVGVAFQGLLTAMEPIVMFLIDVLLAAFEFVWPGIMFVVGMVVDAVTGFINGLKNVFEGITNFVSSIMVGDWGGAWDAILQIVGGVIEAVWNFISLTLVGRAFGLAKTALTGLKSFFTTIWTGIQNFVKTVINNINTVITNVMKAISSFWKSTWTTIKNVASTIWNGIRTVISTVFNAIKSFIATIIDGIKLVWQNNWNNISKIASTIWNAIKTTISTVFNAIKSFITTVINGIKTVWTNVWNAIKTTATTIWNGIKTVITTVFNAVKNTITNVINGIKSVWNSVWNGIKTFVTNTWNNIKSGVSLAINYVKTTITGVLNAIKTAWSTQWNTLKNTVSNIWNAIKSAIKTAIEAVKNTIKNVLDGIKNTWSTIWNGLKDTAKSVWDGIRNVIKTPIDAIVGFINGLRGPIDAAIGWFNNLFGSADRAQGKANSATSPGGGGGGRNYAMAAGGILTRATNVVAGEAGREAFVPLDRPLSQVSPDVRWLSAIGQGLAPAPQAAPSAGPRIVFEAGAIVVQGATDSRRTAHDVADVIAERIAS